MLISSSSHCIPQVDMANIPLTRLSFANSLVRCFDDIENRDTPPNLCVLHIFFFLSYSVPSFLLVSPELMSLILLLLSYHKINKKCLQWVLITFCFSIAVTEIITYPICIKVCETLLSTYLNLIHAYISS